MANGRSGDDHVLRESDTSRPATIRSNTCRAPWSARTRRPGQGL